MPACDASMMMPASVAVSAQLQRHIAKSASHTAGLPFRSLAMCDMQISERQPAPIPPVLGLLPRPAEARAGASH